MLKSYTNFSSSNLIEIHDKGNLYLIYYILILESITVHDKMASNNSEFEPDKCESV